MHLLNKRPHRAWVFIREHAGMFRDRNIKPGVEGLYAALPPLPPLPSNADIPEGLIKLYNTPRIPQEVITRLHQEEEHYKQQEAEEHRREEQLRQEISKKRYQEADWVLLKRNVRKLDIDYLREKTLQKYEGRPDSAKELVQKQYAEEDQLNKWMAEEFIPAVVQQQKDELTDNFTYRAALVKDPKEKVLLEQQLATDLTQVKKMALEKVLHWLQIETLDYDAVPELEGVPPLPSRGLLKAWYNVNNLPLGNGVDQKLKRWYELITIDRDRLSLHVDPKIHLERDLDWNLHHAPDQQTKEKIKQAHSYRVSCLQLLELAPPPPDCEKVRRVDSLSLDWVKKKTGSLPSTRQDLYDRVASLNQEADYKGFVDDGLEDAHFLKLARFRERHPNADKSKLMSFLEDRIELVYDQVDLIERTKQAFLEHQKRLSDKMAQEMEKLNNTRVADILDDHPEWEDEIKDIIQNSRWVVDLPRSKYEEDYKQRLKLREKHHDGHH